ncbi:glycoside hydrolase superfamily [Talaromyces proteolyticus]|uniref:Glycoside hydrolase superfamily n=1 Tax=Talaromyces proteolyticus TaxID=1131652 RepID=A0AAD4KMV2_9EURO|nr:glycoside hydrolase superfamily [Talaromyces proteolyticus]KAH8693950.1 glycoside hydrolase superfamily [Talaromyces proteolyticus]
MSILSNSVTLTAFTTTDGLNFKIAFLNNSDMDYVLDDIALSDLKISRVWGLNDVNTIPVSGRVWADGLQKLDYAVSGAESRGVKLIINIVNNWDNYRGMNAYVVAYGGTLTGWYNNTQIQAAYQTYIKVVIDRYSTSSIKSLDFEHMATISDVGFGFTNGSDGSYPYTFGEGLDFVTNLCIPTINFDTFHLYTNSWGEALPWGRSWVSTHGAACAAIGKPCVLEEFGVTYDQCTYEAQWQATALNTSGSAANMFWQYESPNNGNTIYYSINTYTCIVMNHIKHQSNWTTGNNYLPHWLMRLFVYDHLTHV